MKDANENKSFAPLSPKDISFLREATSFVGSKWPQIKKVVESKSLISVIGFALRNFRFLWKNRKQLMNFDSQIMTKVLNDQQTREMLLDNLLGVDGANLKIIADIIPKLTGFLKSWFMPKSMIQSIPKPYKKLINDRNISQVIVNLQPALIKKILISTEKSQRIGADINKYTKLLQSKQIKIFFDKNLYEAVDDISLAKKNSIVSALANYVHETNPMFRQYLAEFIQSKMLNPTHFDKLISAFSNKATGKIEEFLQKQKQSQILLFEMFRDITALRDEIKTPLINFITHSDNLANFKIVLQDIFTVSMTQKIVDEKDSDSKDRFIYIKGLTDIEGKRAVEDLSDIITDIVINKKINATHLLNFALDIMQGKNLTADQVKLVMKDLKIISKGRDAEGKILLVKTIESMMPLLRDDPVMSRALSNMVPQGNVSLLMDNLKPVLVSLVSSGQFEDPDLLDIMNLFLLPPEEGKENDSKIYAIIDSLTKFSRNHVGEVNDLTDKINSFLRSDFVSELTVQSAAHVLVGFINGGAGHPAGVPLTGLPEGLVAGGFAGSLDSAGITESEYGEITTMIAKLVTPFVSNAVDISQELSKFLKVAKELTDFQLAASSEQSPSLLETEKMLKENYKRQLKSFIHTIFDKGNSEGLKEITISPELADRIAKSFSHWVFLDRKRQHFLSEELFLDQAKVQEIVNIFLPVALQITKSASQHSAKILALVDNIIDLDTNKPVGKMLSSMLKIMSKTEEIVKLCGDEPSLKEQVKLLFDKITSSLIGGQLTKAQQSAHLDAPAVEASAAVVELPVAADGVVAEAIVSPALASPVSTERGKAKGYGEVVSTVTSIVVPFVANTGAIYGQLSNFLQTAKALYKLKEQIASLEKAPDDSVEMDLLLESERLLKHEYKDKLKDFIHQIFDKSNFDGLKDLQVSADLSDKIVKSFSSWIFSDSKREAFLSGELDLNLQKMQEIVSLILPIAVEVTKSSAENSEIILGFIDKILTLDTTQPIDKIFSTLGESLLMVDNLINKCLEKNPELTDQVKVLFDKTKEVISILIDKKLVEVTNIPDFTKIVDGKKLIEAIGRISNTKLSSVGALLTNISQFSLLNNAISNHKESHIEKHTLKSTIEERNRILRDIVEGLFDFGKFSKTFLNTINVDDLTKILVEQLKPNQKLLAKFAINAQHDGIDILISKMVKMVLSISQEALEDDVQPQLINIMVSLMEYAPEKSVTNKFADIFDSLKDIADRKPRLRTLINKEIMDFVFENKEVIKPIMGKVLDKKAKSLSLKLFRAGVDLDRVFSVIKDSFSIDSIHEVLTSIKKGGIRKYNSLIKKLFSSGVVGMLFGSVFNYAKNWFSTSSSDIANGITSKINNIAAHDRMQKISWSDAYFHFDELTAGKYNKNAIELNKRFSMAYFGELTLGSTKDPLRFNMQKLKEVGFDSSKLQLASSRVEYSGCSFEGAKISGIIEEGKIKDCIFSDAIFEKLKFRKVVIENVDFTDVKNMKELKFKDCIFRNCSFSPESLIGMAAMKGCHFVNSKFKGDCSNFIAYKENNKAPSKEVYGLAETIGSLRGLDSVVIEEGRETVGRKGGVAAGASLPERGRSTSPEPSSPSLRR